MSTVIVTGGAGFIGSNFVRHALERRPWRVVVLDKLTYAGNLINLEGKVDGERCVFVKGDIADRDLVRTLFEKHRPSGIVNFAAESHVDRSIDDPTEVLRTNVDGAFELLEAARKFWKGLPEAERKAFRFHQISTDEVYGSLGPTGAFTEETPYSPNSPYASCKAAADHLVRAYHETYGLPALITNCSNNYGPYQFPEKLIPLMILNAAEGKTLPIYGDGGNVRDWLYVEDHCEAILLAYERGRPGEKYNVGGNNERNNLQIVDRICDLLERFLPAASNPALESKGIASYKALKTFVADRPGHDRRYAIDAAKIARELGWTPRHDFDSAMEATVRWYPDHRPWCATVQEGKYERQRLGLG